MKISNLRWVIAGLIVAGAALNYFDRSSLGIASKFIQKDLGISDAQYAQINGAFLIAYAFSYGLGGLIVDRIGTRLGMAVTIVCWSVANGLHGVAHSFEEIAAYRFGLGLFEGMFLPAAMRAIAEWFQPADRSKPVGLLLAGSLLGSILAGIVVSWMMDHPAIGWRWSFFFSGFMGFVLVIPILLLTAPPEQSRFLTEDEALYVPESPYLKLDAKPLLAETLAGVVAHPGLWLLIFARFFTDAVWYTLTFWVAKYLQFERAFTPEQVRNLVWIPSAAADLGAIVGGLTSSAMIRRGWPILRARTTCMLGFACLLPASLLAYLMPPGATGLVMFFFAVAHFGHMAWGTNQLTCHQDLFPTRRVATVMGISGAAGAIGGAVAQFWLSGQVGALGYFPLFCMTAVLHPFAATVAYIGLRNQKPAASRAAMLDAEADQAKAAAPAASG